MGYPHRDRELEGALKLHELMREAEDLQGWLASQKQVAGGGESLGEDYEDVLVPSVAAILSHLTVQDSDSYRNASPV